MFSHRFVRAAILIVFAAFLFPGVGLAQSGSSTISGTVKDVTGAVLPGATVKVINEETGVSVEVITDEQGSYRAATLVPGQYRVESALDGFETAVRRIALEAGRALAIEVTLTQSRLTESVVVTARR